MLRTALRRLRDEEDGFTLIELMVVVMILAILIVMGLPTFLGVEGALPGPGRPDRPPERRPRRPDHVHGQRHVHRPRPRAATGLVTIVPNMCYVAGTAATLVRRHRSRRVRQRRRGRIDQRQLDRDAVHGRPAVLLAVLLRDPRRDDRHEVRQDHGGQLLRGLGRRPWATSLPPRPPPPAGSRAYPFLGISEANLPNATFSSSETLRDVETDVSGCASKARPICKRRS